MLYHRVLGQRVEGLKAGSASMVKALMDMLKLTRDLHQIGSIDVEATHDDNASADWYTLRVANHNEGRPEEARWCSPNVAQNRSPKSYAMIVGKANGLDGEYKSAGDADFKRDIHVKRYAMGTVRWATATADSEAGSPPTVQATDDEFGCQISGGIEISGNTGIKSGDAVGYVIKNDGVPVTFGGSGAMMKVGLANAHAREGATEVAVTNTLSGAVHTVKLMNTPAGKTPNINAGAQVGYLLAEDGNYWCVTDYTDDPVGTVKGWRLPVGANRPAATATSPPLWISAAGSWSWFDEASSRNVPNCGDAVPFMNIGDTGGTVTHDHDPHELSIPPHQLTFTSQTVVSAVDLTADFENCQATANATTTTVCVLAGVS